MRPQAQNFRHMFPKLAKKSSCVLPVTAAHFERLQRLGEAMASVDPAPEVDTIPAGYTYWGQFIDHDVTLDGQSSIDAPVKQRPRDLRNFRSGRLDLDNVYGGGPSIDPWLYDRNADTLAIGVNQDNGPADSPNPNLNFDVPRAPGSQIALIGDPRNDENLFVSQLQHAFLRFHNAVVAGLPAGAGRFKKAREMVRHHYQWAVVHDFLPTVCDPAVVTQVFRRAGPVKNPRLKAISVEFSVAAYRFGHSLVRDHYAINRNFPNEPLSQVFAFVRPPHVPVRSNWVVDFRRFFQTGASVQMNFARPVDPNLAIGLNQLPDEVVAALKRLGGRNLRRGLVLGLPTGQCVAKRLRQPVLSIAQLKQDLPPEIAAILDEDNGALLEKTPLWFYVLQESAVRSGSKHLGPVGSFIVARTFRDMIVQDSSSYLYTPGFTPSLGAAGQFKMADLLKVAGVV